jgi:hypothetical protein
MLTDQATEDSTEYKPRWQKGRPRRCCMRILTVEEILKCLIHENNKKTQWFCT